MDKLQMSKVEWQGVETALRGMILEYDDTNNRISLGLIDRWRDVAVMESHGKDIALEIGSGPGTLAIRLMSRRVICLDSLKEMHKAAKKRIPTDRLGRFRFIVGSGEEMSIRNESIDIIFCAFSFRDFHDKLQGILEMYRVMKHGGRLVILDIAKYNTIHGKLMYFYLNNIAPFLAPKSRRSIKSLAKTYRAFGTPDYYSRIIEKAGFRNVNVRYLSMGLAFILTAEKGYA